MSKQAGAGGVSLFLSVCFFVSFFGGEKKNKRKSSRLLLLLYSECPFLLFGLDSIIAA